MSLEIFLQKCSTQQSGLYKYQMWMKSRKLKTDTTHRTTACAALVRILRASWEMKILPRFPKLPNMEIKAEAFISVADRSCIYPLLGNWSALKMSDDFYARTEACSVMQYFSMSSTHFTRKNGQMDSFRHFSFKCATNNYNTAALFNAAAVLNVCQ